jgi:hypothetical protein
MLPRRSDISLRLPERLSRRRLSPPSQLYQAAESFEKAIVRLFFGIGGLKSTKHGGCLIDPLYGLLNSLFYPFELVWSTPPVLSE